MKLKLSALAFALMLVLVFGVYLNMQSGSGVNQTQNSATNSVMLQQTTSFEETTIAIFTQNPTLALSSTPFFGQIIYNDLVRRLEENPNSFQRPVSAFAWATAAATKTSLPDDPDARMTAVFMLFARSPMPEITSTLVCSPVIETRTLYETSEEIQKLLKTQNVDAEVSVFSSGVSGIDQACTIPFQPTFTWFQFQIKVENTSDTEHLAQLVTKVLTVLSGDGWQDDQVARVSGAINIFLQNETNPLRLDADYLTAMNFYKEGLRGEQLVEALGGLKEDTS